MNVVEQEVAPKGTPKRVPASQRLGPITHDETVRPEHSISEHNSNSRERLPDSSRLGERKSPTSLPRGPVTSRLGPVESLVNATPVEEAAIVKRRPERPPGRRKVTASPKPVRSTGAKKRKSETAHSCRKQLNTEEVRAATKKPQEMRRGETSRPMASGRNSHSPDHVPLSRTFLSLV